MSFYDVIINNDNNNDNDNIFEKEIFTINSLDNIINIDLRNKMPPIDNYELLGSTANSIAILIEYDIPNYKCSRIFLYYNERLNTDNYNINSSIKSLLEYGFCSSENYPYNSELINDEPLEEIYKNAKEKLNKFSIIKIKKDLNSLLLALVNNEPFITTVAIFESFELSNKKIKIPKSNEKQLGGITIVVCGFDISKQIFIIQLMNNYYELPFLYLFKENYSSNCYIFILRNFINFIPITYNKIEELEKIEELKSIDYLDLRSKFTEVYDQGKIGSCTANALCSIFEYDTINFKGSRLFLYYNERIYINSTDKDSGAYLEDGIKSLKTYGLCEEKYWSYIIENVYKEPPIDAYINGRKNYLIDAFNINNNINEIKRWLLRNEPIAISIAIYSNFTNNKSGIINLPTENEEMIGGHATIICGFDDKNKRFIMRNSWGSYWGDKGYFYLPYDYITDNNLCGDLWVITRIIQIH